MGTDHLLELPDRIKDATHWRLSSATLVDFAVNGEILKYLGYNTFSFRDKDLFIVDVMRREFDGNQ